MSRLDGRVAIVTGAAQGIGAVFAKGLAAEGAKVVVADVQKGDAVVEAIHRDGGEAIDLVTDVADPGRVGAMVDATLDRFGQIDILVNNAALYATLALKPFWEIPDEEWDKVMKVNAGGTFLCSKAVVPAMIERGYGKIINITSGTVFKGAPMLAQYVATKGAILTFTRSIARELGQHNICVNTLAPGFTESEGVLENKGFNEPLKEKQINDRALKRVQTPEDLVGTLIYLASADSDFVTGQTILVDGGALTH